MSPFKTFFIGIAVAFGLPWVLLIIAPSLYLSGIGPASFGEDEETQGFYPMTSVDSSGREIYVSEGCFQCHTQMIRPLGAGIDVWRKGWGMDQEEFTSPLRPSRVRDYLGEDHALLGTIRSGPDLSGIGYRRSDANWHFVHLYAPRSMFTWSNMPAYRHLFETREIIGGGAADALALPPEYAPEPGYEVVPKPEARALVRYLLSLKKDSPVPAALADTAAN